MNDTMTPSTGGDELVIAGQAFTSRLLTGTGKYRDLEETREAIKGVLTPEQAMSYDSLTAEHDRRRAEERDERVTTPAAYEWVLRYDAEAFAGVSRDRFLEALAAEGAT